MGGAHTRQHKAPARTTLSTRMRAFGEQLDAARARALCVCVCGCVGCRYVPLTRLCPQNKVDGWIYRSSGDKTQAFSEGTALYSQQDAQVCVGCGLCHCFLMCTHVCTHVYS